MMKRLINRKGLIEKGITMGNTKLWKMIKEGSFPAAFSAGSRERVWRESDIDDWIEQRAADHQEAAR